MNTAKESERSEQLRHRAILYLYGELEAADAAGFERELAENSELALVFEQEQRLNSAVPPGLQPRIDEERLQGNRWVLRQRLMRETRPRFSLTRSLSNLRQRPLLLVAQGAALAMTFMLGVLVSSAGLFGSAAPLAAPSSPIALVGAGDYEIYQLQVNDFDAATGAIDLSFALTSETRLSGNVADQQIHQLMASALRDDIGSAGRLDTINALQPVRGGSGVHEALIHVLMNDENPGVRYQAVTALADLAGRDSVREALRSALAGDMNDGVRVQAFNALMSYRDEQTLELFREQLQNDSNEYIRTQSRSILDGTIESDDLIF